MNSNCCPHKHEPGACDAQDAQILGGPLMCVRVTQFSDATVLAVRQFRLHFLSRQCPNAHNFRNIVWSGHGCRGELRFWAD
eukprot:582332-Amphidinium_carterae.1